MYSLAVLALARSISAPSWESVALTSLGMVAHARNNIAAALSRYQESLSVSRRSNAPDNTAACLVNLLYLTMDTGDYIAARAQIAECLRLIGKGRRYTQAWILETASRCVVAEVRTCHGLAPAPERMLHAAQLGAAAEALRRETKSPILGDHQDMRKEHLTALKQVLGEEAFETA